MKTQAGNLSRNSNTTGTRRMACGDTGTKCNAVFEGRNDDQIVLKAIEHLSKDHGVPLSVDLATRVRGLIKTV